MIANLYIGNGWKWLFKQTFIYKLVGKGSRYESLMSLAEICNIYTSRASARLNKWSFPPINRNVTASKKTHPEKPDQSNEGENKMGKGAEKNSWIKWLLRWQKWMANRWRALVYIGPVLTFEGRWSPWPPCIFDRSLWATFGGEVMWEC